MSLCKQIWGQHDGFIQNCDEYPFASTCEGSHTGAPEPTDLQRYSVRVIDAGTGRRGGALPDDNQHVGRDMLENAFYKLNRVLDRDLFLVRVIT